jgi:hypothetical protein
MSAQPGSGSLEDRLLAAVERLSRTGELPVAQGGEPADEVAARFDDLYTDYVGSLSRLPAESQLVSLQALDTAIHQLSGLENGPLWKESAVRSDSRWHELRKIARIVLAEFGR